MKYRSPGTFPSAALFRQHLRALDPTLDCSVELAGGAGPLGKPLAVAGRVLANRFCIHPMEGWDGDGDGRPSAATLRRWHRFGQSGAALIWGGEAFAVQAEGRAHPQQLYLNPAVDTRASLSALRAEVLRGAPGPAPFLGLQLTHSGRLSCPEPGRPAPRIAVHHPVLDSRLPAGAKAVLLSDQELEDIGARFVEAARRAAAVGFDFVDVKCCHGYLLHELLMARERPGPHGGSFENRTRLLGQILAAIRAECPGLTVAVRVSAYDLQPFRANPQTGRGEPEPGTLPSAGFGFRAAGDPPIDATEPVRLLQLLQQRGVSLISVSLSSPYFCPHAQRPAAFPPSDGYSPPEDPLLGVARHLHAVRNLKAACPEIPLVGAGYSYLQEYLPHVAEYEVGQGFVDLVGLGRMVLAYPELPWDVLHGRRVDRKRLCRTFSDCTSGPRQGLPSGCYPLDPYYHARPEARKIRLRRRSKPS